MKKTIAFFLSFLAMALTASAQIEDDGFKQNPDGTPAGQTGKGRKIVKKTKDYAWEFSVGPRAGAGLSMMSESDGLEVKDGSGMAYGGGLAANIRLGGKDKKGRPTYGQGLIGFGLELNYKNYTVKTKGNDDLKLGYFEVPVMVQLYPFCASKRVKNLYVEAGVTFAASLSSSPDDLVVGNASYKTGNLKGNDVKPTFGLGYRFKNSSANDGFYANIRYYLSTSKLADSNFPGKVSSAELSVGYLFNILGGSKNKKK